jgi:hypothetical protein
MSILAAQPTEPSIWWVLRRKWLGTKLCLHLHVMYRCRLGGAVWLLLSWCCAQEQLYLYYEGHVNNWLIVLNMLEYVCMYFCLLFNIAAHSWHWATIYYKDKGWGTKSLSGFKPLSFHIWSRYAMHMTVMFVSDHCSDICAFQVYSLAEFW